MSKTPPTLRQRVFAVWRRHQRCYFKDIWANGLPPFLEPLLFILALGVGLGQYISEMGGLSYAAFLAPAMMATSSFYTASYETTFGTFIRLEFQKVYDNILATPATFKDVYLGELLWCGTKGLMFSASVLLVITAFGLVQYPGALLTPLVGFLNAVAFGLLGFFVTGFTKSINNLNLYFTAILTPMFFFTGTVFPISQLPGYLHPFVYALPMTHTVILMRALSNNIFEVALLGNLAALVLTPLPFAWVSYYRLRKRLIV